MRRAPAFFYAFPRVDLAQSGRRGLLGPADRLHSLLVNDPPVP